jgi:hypothetical protein
MSQFETNSPAQALSRRALPRGNTPRLGINQTLDVPGVIAAPLTMSQGSQIATQLQQALSGVSSIVSDLGNDARRTRIAEVMAEREFEREQRAILRDQAQTQRQQQAAQTLSDREDARDASVAATEYADNFERGLKAGKFFGMDAKELVASQIAEATAGKGEAYFEAFTRAYSNKAMQRYDAFNEEMHSIARKDVLEGLAGTVLTSSTPQEAMAVYEAAREVMPAEGERTVFSKSIVKAAMTAAEAGRKDQAEMLMGIIPDDTYGVEKQEIALKLQTVLTKDKSERDSTVKANILAMLVDPSSPLQPAYDALAKSGLDGKSMLELRNSIDTEQNKRLARSEKELRETQKQAATKAMTQYAESMFVSGQAALIEKQDIPEVLSMTPEELKSQASKAREAFYRAKYPETPANEYPAAYIQELAQNHYYDPRLEAKAGGFSELISTAMIDQNTAESQITQKGIEDRYAMYQRLKMVNPAYARKLVGDTDERYYVAMENYLQTQPAGGVIGAARLVAIAEQKNLKIELRSDQKEMLASKVEKFTRPWVTSNASNEGDVATRMNTMVYAHMRLGTPFEEALERSFDRIKDTYAIINGMAVEVTDRKITPETQQNMTDVLKARFQQYVTAHPEDKEYMGDVDNWTLEYHANTGVFQMVSKNQMDRPPNVLSPITVLTVDQMVKEANDAAKQKIIDAGEERKAREQIRRVTDSVRRPPF